MLGPKLFLMYFNEIFNVTKLYKLVLFADDTHIFCRNDHNGYNLDLIGIINKELHII